MVKSPPQFMMIKTFHFLKTHIIDKIQTAYFSISRIWLHKLQHITLMEWYIAIKKNEATLHVQAQKEVHDILTKKRNSEEYIV